MIFGVDHNSLVHTENRKKYILAIGEGPTDGLDDTIATTGAKYSANTTSNTANNTNNNTPFTPALQW